jgi:hypothetical protein
MIAGMINFPKKKPEGEFDVTAEGISVFFVEK